MQALLNGATREANKNPNADERTLIREATSVANQAMDSYYHCLSEKEDTEAFHQKLVQQTETVQAAADLFRDFLENKAPKALPKPKANSKPQEDKPAAEERGKDEPDPAEEPKKDEPVPKRRLTGKGQPRK